MDIWKDNDISQEVESKDGEGIVSTMGKMNWR